MLQEPQELLLNLLRTLGGEVGHTDFQKLLFLFTREFQSEPAYDFVPYKFGGFSFTSYADKHRLIEQGLLEPSENVWRLTDLGRARAKADHPTAVALHKFSRAYGQFRGDALVASVYRRYPYYAFRSEIVDRVVPEAEARRKIAAAAPPRQGAGLLTIGYEGKSLEGFLNQLLRESVTLLCDVRRNPMSRKYGFSRSALAKACENVGLRYEHLPELGIASAERQNLGTQADYDALFAEYERRHLPRQSAALSRIAGWIRDGQRVALVCYELMPEQCHRHCVAEALAARIGRSLHIRHLEEICRGNAC